MATAQLNRVTQHIRWMLTAQALGEATDAKLLERFVSQQDEAAFAVLFLGVCRRLLHNQPPEETRNASGFLRGLTPFRSPRMVSIYPSIALASAAALGGVFLRNPGRASSEALSQSAAAACAYDIFRVLCNRKLSPARPFLGSNN